MLRPLLVLSLGLALSAGAHLTATVVQEVAGVPLVTSAEATVFKPRIKRVRIRRDRKGDGFHLRVQSEGGTATDIAKVAVAMKDPTTGKALGTETFTTPDRARALFETPAKHITSVSGDTLKLDITAGEVASDGSVGTKQSTTTIEVSLTKTDSGGFVGEGAASNGWKTRVRINADGEMTSVLMNSNKRWRGDGVYRVAYYHKVGKVAMISGLVRQRWGGSTSTKLSDLDTVDVTTTLYDAKGTVLDTLSETVDLGEDSFTPSIDKIRVAETKKGVAKLVTWTTSPDQDATVEVELTDDDTDKVLFETKDASPVLSQRSYLTGDVEFEDADLVAGELYLVLIDRLDAEGFATGEQFEVEIKAPSAYTDSVGANYASIGDGAGLLGMLRDDDGYYFHVALSGEESEGVSDISIIFEEPFEGPEPLETEVTATSTARFDKWVQRTSVTLPDSFSVDATLSSSDGKTLDTVGGATGTDTGVVYKNGDKDKDKTTWDDEYGRLFGFLEITRG